MKLLIEFMSFANSTIICINILPPFFEINVSGIGAVNYH